MALPAATSQIRPLTGIRGLAAVYVVVYHVLWPDSFQFNRNGYLAVDLFFVLSGFVMAMSYASLFSGGFAWRNFGIFLIRRLARVYPLFFLVTVAYGFAMMAGVIDLDGLEPPVWWTLLLNLLMIQAWGFGQSILDPLWSISTEWAAYLVFPLLATAFLFARWQVALALFVVAFLVLVGLAAAPKSTPTDWRSGPLDISWVGSPLPVVRCVAEFCLGLVAYRASGHRPIRDFAAHAAVAPVLALTLLLLLMLPDTDLIIVALLPLLMISLMHGTGPVQSFLGWRPIFILGELSYAIYLLHPRLGSFYTKPAAVLAQWMEWEVAWRICFIIVLLAGSWLAHLLVERPGRAAIRRLEPLLLRHPKQIVLAG
ncbi:acyltransferase family protein [Falsiroseomonas sp. E2-1-a20]|uniref:acyltransferase family protein n=1 Tax=Falsiroseomonas sp. E2-1-a20 TaxID=3239300 RepID=UPI003F2CA331